MKLVGSKKQANGRSVVIFDTEGLDIGGFVDMMTANGWQFTKLQVTYMANDNTKKRKPVPPNRVSEIYRKYGFNKWSFEAVCGQASVTGTMDCNRNAIAITSSKGGGYKMLDGMSEVGYAYNPQAVQQQQRKQQNARSAAQDPYSAANRYQGTAIPQYDPREDEKLEAERVQARNAARYDQAAAESGKKKSKHTAYIVIAVIEMLFIAPIVFALFAISDTLKGRKALEYDMKEAKGHFKEARNLLIGGAIAAVAFGAILFWKFGSYIPFLPH